MTLIKTTLVLVLVIVFLGGSTVSVEAENSENIENNWSIMIQPMYTTIETETINESLEEARGWSEFMERALTSDFEDIIDEETGEAVPVNVRERSPMLSDEIENATGVELGISYNIPEFPGTIYTAGSYINPDSDMSGEIKGEVVVEPEDPEEESVYIDLAGETSHEVDLDLNSIHVGIKPEIMDNLNLSVAAGSYWGEGEVKHESRGELEHFPDDAENIEGEELEGLVDRLQDIEDARLEYNSDLDVITTWGIKAGIDYTYPLSENLSLIASGSYRRLEVDIETDREIVTVDADDTLFAEYYEDEFDFELPAQFSEELGGLEFKLGGSLSF